MGGSEVCALRELPSTTHAQDPKQEFNVFRKAFISLLFLLFVPLPKPAAFSRFLIPGFADAQLCRREWLLVRARAASMDDLQDGVLQFLDAVEPPVWLTPRDRLERGLNHDSEWEGVKGLHSAALASLAVGDEVLGIRCLLALAELCREVECSEHLGAIGGHQSILRLMTDGQLLGGACRRKSNVAAAVDNKQLGTDREPASNTVGGDLKVICDSDLAVDDDGEGEDDDVQTAAALAAARIVASGCVFPMRASFPGESSALGRFPLRYDFVVASNSGGDIDPPPSCSAVDAARSRSLGAHASQVQGTPTLGGGEHTEHISILVRPVKERQHSQFDVGFQMWPAAVILSRYLCRHPEVIHGRRVLEVGAGLGLCGLVAAHFATAVTLSDFNPVVLRALEGNVALNSRCTSSDHADSERGEGCGRTGVEGSVDDSPVRGTAVAIAEQGGVSVRHLDWDTLPVYAPGVWPLCPSSSDRQDANQAWTPSLATCEANRGDVDLADSGEGEDVESIEHGDRFDVIIASDHICQTSDAEGTIRVLQTLMADGGQAHFVVAHPRTRYGVDALVPLLKNSPNLEFTCEEVSDPGLVEGLEEAAYLAWLHVHVWWAGGREGFQEPATEGEGVGCVGLLVAG